VLAITPVDCTDLCRLAEVLYPLALVVVGLLAFAIVVWIGRRALRHGTDAAAPDGLTRTDVFLAANDALLLGLLGVVIARACGLSPTTLPFDVGIPSEVTTVGSAWLGSLLLLLALRSRSPSPSAPVWPGIAATLGTTVLFAAAAVAIRAVLTGRHPGPCLAKNVELYLWPSAAFGAVIAAAGSLFARMSLAEPRNDFPAARSGDAVE
jgi:hypothetical protein